jgi:hypothetical protein
MQSSKLRVLWAVFFEAPRLSIKSVKSMFFIIQIVSVEKFSVDVLKAPLGAKYG